MKVTDLNTIKDIAITFLYLEPQYKDKSLPIFIAHPFFDSSFQMDYETGNMYNIFEQIDLFEKNRTYLKNEINNVESASNIFYMICKPYKLTFFKYVKEYLSKKEYAEILKSCWITTEFTTNNPNVKITEFISWFKESDKNFLMNKKELQIYNNLPETITIYRGVGDSNFKNGISWTLDKDKAIWFSNRFNYEDRHVYKATIHKEDILAYIDERNEKEIIIDTNKILTIGEI